MQTRGALAAWACLLPAALGLANVQLPSAPSAANILVVRTSGTTASLDEYLSTTANQTTNVQTIAVAGCNLATGGQLGYGTNSMDGQYALFTCGATSTTTRNVARVAPGGLVDLSQTYTNNNAAYQPRSIASVNGSYLFPLDAHAPYVGAFGTTIASTNTVTTSYYYFSNAVATMGGTLTMLYAGCTGPGVPCNGSIWYGTPALPQGAQSPVNQAIPGITLYDPGTFLVSGNTIYFGSDTPTLGGGLYKWTSVTGTVSSTWTPYVWGTGGLNKNPSSPTVLGVHGMAGRVEASVYTIYFSSSAVVTNWLYRYDTSQDSSNKAGSGYTVLAQAPAGNQFMGVFAVPISITPTPSRTASSTPTASITSSKTASSTSTASLTASITPSSSITASASLTSSATASSSNTASASLSFGTSPSMSITASQTATSSRSSTGSATNTASSSNSASDSRTNTPSSSDTATNTNSITASRTQTPSITSTPTSTRSTTPTTSITSSQTPSVTPVAFAAPPYWGNILAVRTSGATASVDEFLPSTPNQASYQQTLPVPGCQLAVGASQAYGSNTANGLYALFPCGLTGSVYRYVARISVAGVVDTSTYYTTSNVVYLPRSASSPDGQNIYIADAHAMWYGQFGTDVTVGLSTLNYYFTQQVTPFNGVMTLVTTGCNVSTVPCPGFMYYSSTALPTSSSGTFNLAAPGLVQSMPSPGNFLMGATSNVMYFGADATIAGSGLYRWNSVTGTIAGTWTPYTFGIGAVFKNPTAAASGVHGLASRAEAEGVFALYLSTSATTGNLLYRYDTSYDSSAVVGAGYTLLSTAPANSAYLAVMVVPAVPSSTPTRTSTQSSTHTGTPTPTTTPTSTGTGSPSPSTTASGTATPSSSASNTGTVTPSPSGSISPGATSSSSLTAVPTQTSTASSSITASLTPSGSITSSQTASLTASSSYTASVSATVTPTSSLTPTSSVTASQSATPSTTSSNSHTGSNTRSSTPTPTASITPVQFRNAFNPANVLVVRTSGTSASVDEYLPSTASQTSAVQTLVVPNCQVATGADQSYASMSFDGGWGFFTCGLSTSMVRYVARISPAGIIDTRTTYTTSQTVYLPRGVASTDGSQIWLADGHALWYGTFATTITVGLTAVEYYNQVAIGVFGGVKTLITAGCAVSTVPCPTGSSALYYNTGSSALPTTATGNTFNVIMTGSTSPPDISCFVIADSNTIYVGSDVTTAGGGLYKLQNAVGTAATAWTPYTFPSTSTTQRNPTTAISGIHGMVGRVEAGNTFLYVTTSAATVNKLYRYDTSSDGAADVTFGWLLLATAPASNGFLGVMTVPIQISSTPTPTASKTATSSKTGTSTPSSTLTPSASLSVSQSGSVTASPSASLSYGTTASTTPSASITAPPTMTSSLTATSTASPTGSVSSSSTPTQTRSTTSSLTATPTPTRTATRTTTPTPTSVAFHSAINPSNILVVRSTGTYAWVDEYLPATLSQASYVQTIGIPSCLMPQGSGAGYGANSQNGLYALWPCGSTASTNRVIARVGPNGVIDTTTNYQTSSVNYIARSVASPDGLLIYIADGHALWTGSFGGTITIGLTTLNYYYGVSVAPFNGVMSLIYSGCAGSGVPCSGSLFYSTTALPTSVTGTFDVAMNGTTDVDPGTFVIADSNTIYVGADATVAGGGLYKFTSIAGTTASYWAPYTFGTNSQVKNPSAASLGVHGLIGRTEGAAYTLYLSTSATTANAVYRYDTSYDSSAVVGAGYSLLTTASAGTGYLAVMLAPVPLTPTKTPTPTKSSTTTQTSSSTTTASASASVTPSPSSSISFGASPSSSYTTSSSAAATPSITASGSGTRTQTGTQTGSRTPTPSVTPSKTGTPTPTPSPSAVQFAAPPASSSLLVVRTLGSGVNVDEYGSTAPAQAGPLQTLSVPACTLFQSSNQGYGSSSADGGFALFPCVGAAGGASRVIARVSPAGIVDVTTTYTTDTSGDLPRGAASPDGHLIYASDSYAIYGGAFGGALTPLTTQDYYFSMQVAPLGGVNTLITSGCASFATPCTGSLFYNSVALPLTAGGGSFDAPMSGVSIPNVGAFVFASSTVLYAGGDATLGGLFKFSSSGGGGAGGAWGAVTWPGSVAGGARNPLGSSGGVHGLAGRAESAGSYALYFTTSAGDALYRYDTAADASSVAGAGFIQLASAPPDGSVFLSVLVVPVVPPTPTPTSTVTASGTASPSASLSFGSTASITASPSASLSSTASGSTTATPSNTPSVSATSTPVSRTASSTRTPSRTNTNTRTISKTGTPSPSLSGTATPSPSGSPTGTPSPSIVASQSGSSSASASASRSASASASGSSLPTASGTRTASRTRTATRSGSGTRSVTPTVSVSATSTSTPSLSGSTSGSVSTTATGSPVGTSAPSLSVAPTVSASGTPPASVTRSASTIPLISPSNSGSAAVTATRTATRTHTATRSPTKTETPTRSPSRSHTGTASPTRTRSQTHSPTHTRSASKKK